MMDFFKGTVTPKDWLFVAAVLGLAMLLSVGFYFGIYTKQNVKLAEVQLSLKETKEELKQAVAINNDYEEFKAKAETAEKLVEVFEKRLPEEREIPKLLQQFEAKATELGLSVGLEQLPTTTDPNKETIPYEIVALGGFHEIVQFINLLERDTRYLKVSNLDIDEETAGVSEASFTLSTFRFIQSDNESKIANEPGK
tara:strand:+ start:212 stop:802 length:591 start_codon:yes stop_codon:yes gene_type:complete